MFGAAGTVGSRKKHHTEDARFPIPVGEPFTLLSTNLIGPFPKSKQTNRLVVTTVDYMTWWGKARAVPTGSMMEAVAYLLDQVMSALSAQVDYH
ncbi:hypothetical protein PR048_012785 [Dryococelus australis]|uniref:Integrase catalytic domain-containing protein n=1 Tax=Dryococelus australis TaxID=614101 RepID=A0ABQ9HQB4_9NEOP|nr:hypothetical protein PR048_012785 [Dryococelus australis]